MYIPQYTIQSSTNFKAWITDLKQATMAVESFKNITATFKGTGLNAIIDDVTVIKYSNSIRGLTLEQAKLALSTTQLSTHEKELILTEAGLIAKTKELTASQVIETLQQELGDKVDAQSLLIKAKLITAKEIEEDVTMKVTASQLAEAVSKEKLTVEQSKLIASTFGVTGANYGEAVSFEVLTKAIWANIAAIAKWLVTNPVGWIILATGAIAGIVAVVNHFTVSVEESREKLSELKNECQTIESDLSSMNDELKTTVDRMNELAQKDTLTFTEKEEYDNLVETNNELQRSIDLLEMEQKLKNAERNKTFVETMRKDASVEDERVHTGKINPDGTAETEYITETELIAKKFETLYELQEKLRNATTQAEIDAFQEQIDRITKYLLEKNDEWKTDADGISYISNPTTEDDKAVNEWLDYINDFQDKMAIAMRGENAKTNAFKRLVDNWKFDETVQLLQDLGKQGRVTADMLNDSKYDEFINQLVTLGVIDSAENLDEIALAFNNFDTTVLDTSETVDTATYSIYTFKTAVEDLKSTLDDTFDAQSTIQSAFDKITEGTALSAEEVLELVKICSAKFPEISTLFTKTADGYVIDSQKLIDANAAMVADTKKSYEERIQYLNDFINTPFDTTDISSEAEARMYQTWAENVESAKTELSELELVLSMLGITASSTATEFEKLAQDHASKIDLITQALTDQSEQGHISTETYLELIKCGDEYADCLEWENGRLTVNEDKLKDLSKQQYTTAKSANALAIAELELKAASLAAHGQDYSDIQAQIEALMKENAIYAEAISEIENAKPEEDNGKKDPKQVTDFLADYAEYQHEIAMGRMAEDQDYYDWLESAAEKAYAGLKDYEEDLWKYQEEVYEGRKQLADDYLNNRIEDREAQIEITLDTSKADDGTKLNTKEKFDYVRDCYKEILAEIKTRINDLIQSGVATNSEAIQELEKQAQEYRDKLNGVLTDEIETEMDYLKNMQDEWDKVYDDKINAIEKEKSAMEERYDSEIDKIDEQINALQKTNDEKQRELDIEKARQEREKAGQRTRKVYDTSGRGVYRQDTEAIAEAQKKLDDLLLEQVIDNLEAEKENLEKNRELEAKQFEEQIELQKQEQKAKEDFYTKLLEILENYLNPKATESNSNVWESVLGDTENVKKSNGNVEVKGADIDTSSLKKGILNSVDIINWLEKLGASTDIIKAYANGTGNTTTMAMQTSMNNTASKQFDNQHKTSAWSESRDDYKLASANQNKNINAVFNGGINIHNPVGNSDDLASELLTEITNALERQIYTNLKD